MGARSEERGKLSDKVYDRLTSQIAAGEWPEGARIPTEAELALTHGVSRPVVREALYRLRSEGIINSRRGSGSIVLAGNPLRSVGATYKPIENVVDLIHTFEFRASVECDTAAIAAVRGTLQQIAAIQSAHEALGDNISDDTFGDLDLAFHLTIAKTTGNPMFETTLIMLHSQIIFGMRVTGEFRPRDGATRIEVVRREHKLIVDAIEGHDPKGAYSSMRDHLKASRFRILGFEPTGDWQGPDCDVAQN
jgi:GntR family transcriptional regulator, transcriptional repressor for pyruvate dehydrogenase complex